MKPEHFKMCKFQLTNVTAKFEVKERGHPLTPYSSLVQAFTENMTSRLCTT